MRPLVRSMVVSFVLATAVVASAEEPLWVGTFVNEQQSSEGVDAAIETAVANMNFVTRPIARSRLKKTNAPYKRISIGRTAQAITVAFDGQAPIAMPADGRAVEWTRSDGEVFDVSASVQGDALVQTFKAEDGERINTFTANAAGQMTLEAKITSPQLKTPVIYTLLYGRAR